MEDVRDRVIQLDPTRLTSDVRMHLMANPFETEVLHSGAKAKFRPETCTFEGWGYGDGSDIRAYAMPKYREGFFHLAVFDRDGTILVYLSARYGADYTPSPEMAKLYKGCTSRWLHHWRERLELRPGQYLGWVDAQDPKRGAGLYPWLENLDEQDREQEWLDELHYYKQDRRAV